MGRKLLVRPGQEKNGLYITQVSGTGSRAVITTQCRDCNQISTLNRQMWSYGTPVCKSCEASKRLFTALASDALSTDSGGTFYLVEGEADKLVLRFIPFNRERVQLTGKLKYKLVRTKFTASFEPVSTDLQDSFTRPLPDEAYYAICPIKTSWTNYFVNGVDDMLSPEEETLANETFLEYVLPNDEIPDFAMGSATTWVEGGIEMRYLYVRTRGFAQLKDPTT